ncbi:hypothetical protein LguiA_011724 [Lonicera macranthoides]
MTSSTSSSWEIDKGNHTYCKQMCSRTDKETESKEPISGSIQQLIFIPIKFSGTNSTSCTFYVDNVPIRVFKNYTSKGVSYPTQPMQIEVSLWDGDSWATDGGQTKTNWSHSPFKAHFQGFNIDGCPSDYQKYSKNIDENCYSSNYWWNSRKYWKLDPNQQKAYGDVRANYMNYDYCRDTSRFPHPPPECLP